MTRLPNSPSTRVAAKSDKLFRPPTVANAGWVAKIGAPLRVIADYRIIASFILSGALALVAVFVIEAWLFHRGGKDEAVRDAQATVEMLGNGVVAPALEAGITTGDPGALARFDELVRERLLLGPIVRIKLWTEEGRIVYSDESALIGAVFPLADDEIRALRDGSMDAQLSDLSSSENEFEREEGRLLEVYMGLTTLDGRQILFEAYLRASSIDEAAQRMTRAFIPAFLVGFVLLELVQLPLAWSLGRKLIRGKNERHALIRDALEVSDMERRRIAGLLHDGAVQDLTGLSYSFEGKAARLEQSAPPEVAEAFREAAAQTRANVDELRATLAAIYPAEPARAGLAAVIRDLCGPLSASGIAVTTEIPTNILLRAEVEGLLYRAARETLANVLHHSGASFATLRLSADGARAVMVVEDDGRGFSTAQLQARQAQHHMGLRILSDLVGHSGGTFQINSEPGRGTTVAIELPLQ